MNRVVFHIDFNSYFATVEQQANPRLRGKPIGVSGGDRLTRTVLGAASVEAKARGVKTGMTYAEAIKFCPEIILVKGDSDKYLSCTKKFLNILKDYSDKVEVFSIDEVFLCVDYLDKPKTVSSENQQNSPVQPEVVSQVLKTALKIKQRIRKEVGEWIRVSVGISYNKLMAKLAGSLYKPDGLVAILDTEAAEFILDRVELDDVCGIGFRIKKRLNDLGVYSFSDLRRVPLKNLIASFKDHWGHTLYNMARGIDESPIVPFQEKEEVKSVGHRLTLSHDTSDKQKIKQVLLKLSELVARRLRAKKLVGKTVSLWYRLAFNREYFLLTGSKFFGEGMQTTIGFSDDGMEIFKAGWKLFLGLWEGGAIRMIGISVSNLKPKAPQNLTFLEDKLKQEKITLSLDKINDRFGEFTLQRGILLGSTKVRRMPNPFLSDRRFRI